MIGFFAIEIGRILKKSRDDVCYDVAVADDLQRRLCIVRDAELVGSAKHKT